MELADEHSILRYKKPKLSKNVVSERRRRQKMNKLLYTLRALVPNISKMDKASILADAIEYVEKLKQQVERAESDVQSTNVSALSADPRVEETDSLAVSLDAANRYGSDRKYHVQVEVRVEESIVEVRIRCKQEHGILFHVTRALETLPFQLKNFTFSTLNEYLLLLNVVLQVDHGFPAMSDYGLKQSIEDSFGKQGLILTSGNSNGHLWQELK